MTFLEVWIGYTLIGVMIFSLMFIWAVRTGQFSGLERAGRIALDADKPIEDPGAMARKPSLLDRLALMCIALVSAAVIGCTLWVAFRAG